MSCLFSLIFSEKLFSDQCFTFHRKYFITPNQDVHSYCPSLTTNNGCLFVPGNILSSVTLAWTVTAHLRPDSWSESYSILLQIETGITKYTDILQHFSVFLGTIFCHKHHKPSNFGSLPRTACENVFSVVLWCLETCGHTVSVRSAAAAAVSQSVMLFSTGAYKNWIYSQTRTPAKF